MHVRLAALAAGIGLVLAAPPVAFGGSAPSLALWMEPSANLPALSTRQGVAAILDRAKAAGVTVVIPEAKTAWGFVTYRSEFAPSIGSSPIARPYPPEYAAPATWYPADYDMLQVIIEEAHARGIQVHAAVNVFGEGYNPAQVGTLFEHPSWQAQHASFVLGVVPSSQVGLIAFANPALQEVQLYELAIIGEILQHYAIDGIVLDRLRYPDITADVSDESRQRFEQWLGHPVAHWPDDVVQVEDYRTLPGPLFPQWAAWHAGIIKQFTRAASVVVRRMRPDVAFADYVGGWYPFYWNEGVNWAAPDAPLPISWATPQWREAGIAPYFDYLLVGLYYPEISWVDALREHLPTWASVEGGAYMARTLTAGATTPVGSLLLPMYEGRPEVFRAALRSLRRQSGGVMLFDLVFVERYGWWDLLRP